MMAVLRYLRGDPSFLIKNAAGQKAPENNDPEISVDDLRTSDMPHRNQFLTYELSRGCPNAVIIVPIRYPGFSIRKWPR